MKFLKFIQVQVGLVLIPYAVATVHTRIIIQYLQSYECYISPSVIYVNAPQ